jgi:hypothetical protein
MLDRSPLYALGFEELPPAGYLPWGFEDMDDVARQTAAQILFGPEVDVRVLKCRADFVAHAIEQVQHMDRIPLKGHVNGRPKIDLLIPCESSDLKSTWTGTYGWSAFVRRREDVPLPTAGSPGLNTIMLAALAGLLAGAATTPPPVTTDAPNYYYYPDNNNNNNNGVAKAPDVPEPTPAKPARKAPTKGRRTRKFVAPEEKPSDLPGTKPAEATKVESANPPEAKPAAAVGGFQPYGLPRGTHIRQGAAVANQGPLAGQAGFPPWVYQLGQEFGLTASTYPGHQETSGYNRGIDWWPAGTRPDMTGRSYTPEQVVGLQAFANYAGSIPGIGTGNTGQVGGVSGMVIFQNPITGQKTGFYEGRPDVTGSIYAGTYGEHQGHVHLTAPFALPLPGPANALEVKPDLPERKSADEPEVRLADAPQAKPAKLAKKAPTRGRTRKLGVAPEVKPDLPGRKSADEPEVKLADAPQAKPAKLAKKAPTRGRTRKLGVAPEVKPDLPGRKSADQPEVKLADTPQAKPAKLAKKAPTKGRTRKLGVAPEVKRSDPPVIE